MKRSRISTTTGFRSLLRLSGRWLLWLLLLLLINEAVFYVLTNVYPKKGDYQLEVQKAGYPYKCFFMGTSRTHRGVNTPFLDSLQGHPSYTFNLADVRLTLLDQYIVMQNLFCMGASPTAMIFELAPVRTDNSSQPITMQKAILPILSLSSSYPLQDQLTLWGNMVQKHFSLLYKLNTQSFMVERYTRAQGFDAVSDFSYDGSHHVHPIQSFNDDQQSAEEQRIAQNTILTARKIIGLCELKGVKVCFLLPVQMTPDELSILRPVWSAIPDHNKWDTWQHPDWSLLKADSCWKDAIHLTIAGSRVYTKILFDTYPAEKLSSGK